MVPRWKMRDSVHSEWPAFLFSAASKYRRRACECLRTAGRNGSSRNRPLLLGSRDFERFAFNLLCFFCFLFHADEVDGQQRRLCRKIKKSSEAFLTLGAGCRSRGQGVSLVGGEKGAGALNQQGPEEELLERCGSNGF